MKWFSMLVGTIILLSIAGCSEDDTKQEASAPEETPSSTASQTETKATEQMKTAAPAAQSNSSQAAPPPAQSGIRTEAVHFKSGASGAEIKGQIVGREIVDYRLGARAGQTMRVVLKTDNTANYFNVMEPGETNVASFIGSTSGNAYEGVLKKDGEYTIRVYQMRSAARRGESANYNLRVDITSAQPSQAPVSPPTPAADAKVAGTDFHATGNIPCARAAGQPMGTCKFGVVREGNGNGSITVFWPDEGNRVIFFEAGTPSHYDQSQADGGAQMTVGKQGDLFTVMIGDQRFELPEAVISGG